MTPISIVLTLLVFGTHLCNIMVGGTTCESQDGEESIECDDGQACCETNGRVKCCSAVWVWVIIAIVVIIMICCCCCCCYFIGKMVHQSSYENSTPVAMQTVRSVEITPSNRQFYVMKTIPFNQPSSNRPSILDAPPSSNHPSFPDAPSSNSHPSISDAPPKYSEIFPTPVKSPPSLETQL